MAKILVAALASKADASVFEVPFETQADLCWYELPYRQQAEHDAEQIGAAVQPERIDDHGGKYEVAAEDQQVLAHREVRIEVVELRYDADLLARLRRV